MEREKFELIVKESKSYLEVARKLGYKANVSLVKKLVKKYETDLGHFDRGASKRKKWQTIEKICPVCSKTFKVKEVEKKQLAHILVLINIFE